MKLSFLLPVATLAAVHSAPISADTPCNAALMRGSIAQFSDTHATVDTAILIDASATTVWSTLTDFESMSSWSTGTLQGIAGNLQDGGSVSVSFIFGVNEDGAPNLMQIPHTLIYQHGHSFGWSDLFPDDIGGGHDNHHYTVQACGDQTVFVQTDEIVGNPYAADFVAQLLPMYQTFNAELKAEVESQS